MTAEENKALVRRLYEKGTVEGTLALVDELFDADFVYYGTGGIELHGVERLKKVLKASLTAFPDMRATIEDIVAEGDKVVARFEITGTHLGEHLGIAPTGKKMTWWAIQIHRIVGGKVVEAWRVEDRVPLLRAISSI